MRAWLSLGLVGLLLLGVVLPSQGSPSRGSPSAGFEVGAASVDVTPPAWKPALDAAFTPLCALTPDAVSQTWTGARLFAFEEPYLDLLGVGRFVPGDPYCDANHNARYDAPWIAGGSGQDKWPLSADAANPVSAQAAVFSLDGHRVALVTVDSIGLMIDEVAAIRRAAQDADPGIEDVLVASTHDESAPDPIGLWGPDGGLLPLPADAHDAATTLAVSSGVDDYYLQFLAQRAGAAVKAADDARQPAELLLAVAGLPSNVQSCWSSYPFIDDQRMPVLQARNPQTGQVLLTLLNGQTHVETLAFSGVRAYTRMLSADWPGPFRHTLEAAFPGSVAMELTGVIGSVETPTVYEPESTQVVQVPGVKHDVKGNPNGCRSVYPEPSSGTPVRDAYAFLDAYGKSMAHTAMRALAEHGEVVQPSFLRVDRAHLCVELENNLFAAAFAAGLFPNREAFVEPTCTLGVTTGGKLAAPNLLLAPLQTWGAHPVWLASDVAVLTMGPVQFASSPGEVFPFTEIRGPMTPAQMPFPTDCYNPVTDDYGCGQPLPMTPWTTAEMQGRYKFLAGLGEDMIGYLFPPGNFVGDTPETNEAPWLPYHLQHDGATDRFGFHHSDDSEALGPHTGLVVTQALQTLLARQGPGADVLPGLFVDASGAHSASPFAGPGFGGAVGVETVDAQGQRTVLRVGAEAQAFATFDGFPEAGTAGTSLPFSVSTAGVVRADGRVLLVDVYEGAGRLG